MAFPGHNIYIVVSSESSSEKGDLMGLFSSKKKNVFVGTGTSSSDDPIAAAKAAVNGAIAVAGKPPTFGIVFAAGKYGKDDASMAAFVKAAHEAFMASNPECKWVGCTTTGELSNFGLARGSVVAMALSSEFIHFGIGVEEYNAKHPEKTGSAAAKNALHDLKLDKYLDPYLQFTAMKNKSPVDLIKMEPYIMMTLFPGTTRTYYSEDDKVLDGIVEMTGAVPLVGGSAGDDSLFKKTYTFMNGKVTKNGCIVVAIVSNLITSIGIKQGYFPTDKIVLVTKAKGKIISEINKRPAAVVYSELTGVPLEELRKNPLPYIVSKPFGQADTQGNYWAKTVLRVLDDNSLVFFAPIKEGTALCLMESKENLILEASKEAIHESVQKVTVKDIEALIVFSCGARTIYLGKNLPKEHALIKKTIGNKPFIGFYTYAEQGRIPNGPVGAFGQTFLCLAITNKLVTD